MRLPQFTAGAAVGRPVTCLHQLVFLVRAPCYRFGHRAKASFLSAARCLACRRAASALASVHITSGESLSSQRAGRFAPPANWGSSLA
jgi:hypothetical protein